MGNNILSAILIDDESFAIANLSQLIQTYCPSLKITGTASSVKEAEQVINQLQPNVIFLDINMPGQNGFDLIERLIKVPYIVFVTAHEKHALAALKASAVDFLLKPISIPELKNTQAKLLQLHSIQTTLHQNYPLVLRNLAALIDKQATMRKLTIHGSHGYDFFDIDDILFLSGEDNYTTFHFLKQKTILVSKTLKDYEEILEPFGFMRIHKSTLVNLMHVKKIIRNESPEILLTNGMKVQVSRRKFADLMEWSKT